MSQVEVKGSSASVFGRILAFRDEVLAVAKSLTATNTTVTQIEAALAGMSPIAPLPFSTTEQAIPGVTWNGNQVYQITITGVTGDTLNTQNEVATVPGLVTLISMTGTVKLVAGTTVPIDYLNFISFNELNTVINETHTDASFSGGTFIVTLLYTKA